MLRSSLIELLRQPESSGLEFKRDDIDGEALAKELVAFANLRGGTVLLGVEDDGSVSGIQRPDLEEWVMQVARDKVRPELLPYFEVVADVADGLHVAVIRVEPGYTVHSLWHRQRNRYVIRVGSTSREASGPELERLFQQRGHVRAELRGVGGSTLADLDIDRLDQYFSQVRGQATPDRDDRASWEQLLLSTEFLHATEDNGAIPTLASLVLFAHQPTRFVPQAGIEAAAYPGESKDYDAQRQEFLGPATARLADGVASVEGRVEDPGIIERAVRFVKDHDGSTVDVVAGRRVRVGGLPSAPVREAIVNAVVHRDYLLSGTRIELSLFSDRLEVVSPGRLPNGITPARMLAGTRASRNQLLKDAMRDYGYLEHVGMGVPRKIVAGMAEHNGTTPELIEDGERFTIVLHR